VQFYVINKGMPATNSTVIVDLLEGYLARYNPHMVIVMMGVNDSLVGRGNEFFLPIENVTFFTELKTYKLARMLWLRIAKSPDSLERYPRTYQELENNHRKTIEMHPGDQKAYIYMGRCYMDDSQYDRAETFFKKAIEINPANNDPYLDLGRCYRNQSRYDQAEAMFKKALAIKPEDIDGYIDLAWCYELQVKHEQAEGLFRKIKLMSPKSEKIFGKLAVCYQEQGRYDLADEYFKIAARLRSESQNPMTRVNYRRLRQLVTQKGIKLVCVQYPMRGAGPLKEMLKPYGAGVVIVDNEKVFKDVLTKRKYSEYFTDDFGGEFGHGTSLGNRILAENIANCVLKQFFDRE
jgi:tetratricopeptide (TPR) repeat protein